MATFTVSDVGAAGETDVAIRAAAGVAVSCATVIRSADWAASVGGWDSRANANVGVNAAVAEPIVRSTNPRLAVGLTVAAVAAAVTESWSSLSLT